MDEPPVPAVEVTLEWSFMAIVTLRGEHDLSGKRELEQAFAEACGYSHVLVDVSQCDFVDSTVIGLLLAYSSKHVERYGRFELSPHAADHTIARALQLTGIEAMIPIHPDRAAAVASMQSEE